MMNVLPILTQWFPVFSIAGVVVLTVCVLISALAYSGRRGERYSFFNHYISELGERGVSRFALLFNSGMTVAGLCFLFFILGLGLSIDNLWSKLGLVSGLVAALACSLVGVFPMNHIKPHIFAAMTYFRAGLLTVLFFGLAILFQPAPARIHPLANLAGLVALASYTGFLLVSRAVYRKSDVRVLDPEQVPVRPRFWILAILEWAIFFSTVLWFFSIAFGVIRL